MIRAALAGHPVGAFSDGGIGPMFGQVGFFHKFAGKDTRQAAARALCRGDKNACSVMGDPACRTAMDHGRRLQHRDVFSMLGWVRNLVGFYGARELVAFG